MTKKDLLDMLEEFDDNTEIRIQDPRNLYQHIPFGGFEVMRGIKGKKIIVLLNTKLLPHEFNG